MQNPPASKKRGAPVTEWWTETDRTKASEAVADQATSIEQWNWHRRYVNLVGLSYLTGRSVIGSYAYSIAGRPAIYQAYEDAEFQAPSLNMIATFADVYMARVFRQRTFNMILPIDGDFQARIRSLRLARWDDALYEQERYWNKREIMGQFALATGDGFIKAHASPDKKRVELSNVLGDEILVSEGEALYGKPRSMIQRVFAHRGELMARYGTTPELRQAIKNAPSAQAGFYWGRDLDTRNIVPLFEAWSFPGPGREGKHFFGLRGAPFEFDAYEHDEWPGIHFQFKQVGTEYFGQGLAEQLMKLQSEIDRVMAAIWENNRRTSWPRWLNPIGSQVNAEQLAGVSGGVIDHMPNLPPQAIFPNSGTADQLAYLRELIQMAGIRARLTQESEGESPPDALRSGAALMAWSSLSDAAHADVGQRLEDCDATMTDKINMVAEKVKPSVKLPGRRVQQIKWDEAYLSRDKYIARVFPVSRLPQLPAARYQQIEDWYAKGEIDKSTQLRLEQLPDTGAFLSAASAMRDDIEMTLDKIVETGEYIPPEPYQALEIALPIAQSRWARERADGTPQDRINLLAQWIQQVHDIAPLALPGPAGIQPPMAAPAAAPVGAAPSGGMPVQQPVQA